MPIVIAPILVGFLLLVTVLVAYALLHQIVVWLRPILGYLLANHQSFWKRVLLYPVRVVAKGILRVEHAVANSLSHATAASLPQLGRFFGGQALLVEELALHLSGWAKASYDALNTLRHTTVPRLISDAVTPVRQLATQARQLATQAVNWETAFSNSLLSALSRVGIGSFSTVQQGVNALVNYTDRLHAQVWQVMVPKLDLLFYTLVPQLTRTLQDVTGDLYNTGIESLDQLRARLRRVEDLLAGTLAGLNDAVLALLASAAGIAAIEAVLTRIAPDLFCNNTKGVTKKLCGLDESLIAELLAGTLGLLVVLDVKQIAHAAQAATGEIEGQIRSMAGV